MQIAIVATARKLAVLCWTMIERGEDYAFAPAVADREEAPRARAARRDALPPRPERQRRRLLPQRGPPPRARARRAGRARVSPARRRLASQAAQAEGGRGRRQWDATEKALCGASCAAGISPRTCASLGGRPRPRAKPNAADTQPPTASARGEDSRTPATRRDTHPRLGSAGSPLPASDPSQPTNLRHKHEKTTRNTARNPSRGLDTFIRRVDHAADLGGEREERDHVLPGVQPRLGDHREPLPPLLVEGLELGLGLVGVDRRCRSA